MKLAIALSTRGRPELLKATVEETLKHVRHDKTELWILIDEDDDPSIAATNNTWLRDTGIKGISVEAREDTLGGKYNRILTLEPKADVYLAMVDYAPHITPGFDEKILEAASLFDDGIGVVYNHMANLSFPQINAVTRKLVEHMGYFFVPYFPYWFVDHWLDDIARMIERISVADVWIDESRRPGTMDRRESSFWGTFFDSAYLERRRMAHRIIKSPEFQASKYEKRRLFNNYPLIEERSLMINNSVRKQAAQWEAAVPPEPIDERYRRVRGAAIERMRGYIAEIEAEQATVAINRKAA